MKKILLFALTLTMSLGLFAQQKKVAVVTFYANRYIEASDDFADNAQLIALIAALAKDPAFDLKPSLEKFHKMFFEEYSKDFPFDIVDEESVLNNEDYKAYSSRDTSYNFLNNSLSMDGYNLYYVSVLYKRDLEKMIEIFDDVDGFLFVYLSYQVSPKIAVGGMGTAGVSARITLKLWSKEKKRVFNIYKGEMSKKTVPLIAGIPVMKVKDILPACESATDNLLEALKGKLPKIVKKAAKKL